MSHECTALLKRDQDLDHIKRTCYEELVPTAIVISFPPPLSVFPLKNKVKATVSDDVFFYSLTTSVMLTVRFQVMTPHKCHVDHPFPVT